MLGASHVPAASAELFKASVAHYVFEAPTFRREARVESSWEDRAAASGFAPAEESPGFTGQDGG